MVAVTNAELQREGSSRNTVKASVAEERDLSVQERHGKGAKHANGYVWGLGERFDGAIASSVGHDGEWGFNFTGGARLLAE